MRSFQLPSWALSSPLHACPGFQLLPPPPLLRLLSKLPSDLLLPNLKDSSYIHSFHRYLLGSPLCTEHCSSYSGPIRKKKKKKLRLLPPAANISVPGQLVPPGAWSPSDALLWLLASFCLSGPSQPSFAPPPPSSGPQLFSLLVDNPTTHNLLKNHPNTRHILLQLSVCASVF